MSGPFASFFDGSLSGRTPQGYAGPVPAKSPGKRNRTDGIIPRPKASSAQGAQALDAPDRQFVEEGFKCSNWPDAEGCLWPADPSGEAKRMRLLAILIPYSAQTADDMYAAAGQLNLDNALSKAPKSLALAIVGVGLELVSAGLASKIGAGLEGVQTAGRMAKGISEASDQVVPTLVNMAASMPVKDIEKVTKAVLTVGKKKATEAVEGIAGDDFGAGKARKAAFLNALQASFRQTFAAIVEEFSGASDEELIVLVQMFKHGPTLAQFKAQFADMMKRYETEGIGKIGATYAGGGKFQLVKVVAYGQETYLNVAQNGTGYIKTHHAADSRGEREYGDGKAGLVSIVSRDLVDMAIQQNGGDVREYVMTWESYQKGESPFPTLDLRKGEREWTFSMKAQFEKWITNAYKQAHGGKSPPKPKDQDSFGWWNKDDDSSGKDAVPANAAQQSPNQAQGGKSPPKPKDQDPFGWWNDDDDGGDKDAVLDAPQQSPTASQSSAAPAAMSQDDASAVADTATDAVGNLF